MTDQLTLFWQNYKQQVKRVLSMLGESVREIVKFFAAAFLTALITLTPMFVIATVGDHYGLSTANQILIIAPVMIVWMLLVMMPGFDAAWQTWSEYRD